MAQLDELNIGATASARGERGRGVPAARVGALAQYNNLPLARGQSLCVTQRMG